VDPEESARHLAWIRRLAWLDPASGEAFRHLAVFLPWGRIAVAVVTSLSLVALYPLLSHLFGKRAALLAVGLLALDPFLVGHSGLLHTDALVTSFILLTLAVTLRGLRTPDQAAWWPLAGLFGGLALLTKSPALILLVFIPFLLFLRYLLSVTERSRDTVSFPRLLLHCSLFVAAVAITFSTLHPGMWGDPAGTLQNSFALAERHVTSVQRPIFFAGRMVVDPGPAFYPLVFLYRISPLALIGLIAGVVCLRHLSRDQRFAFSALLLFAVLFTAGMSLGTKKHTRYLLPVFPPLAVAASLGIDGALTRYIDGWPKRNTSILRFATASIILVQAVIALVFAPYPLTYQNPLLGGPPIASKVIPTGWGEGPGAAALWLNRLPDAERLTVAASSVPSFAPLFEGRTLQVDGDTLPLSDYVVSDSIDGRYRDLVECCSFNLPSRRQPTAVYTNTASLQQAGYLGTQAKSGDLILTDADTPLRRRYNGPAELLSAASIPDEDALSEWLAQQTPGHGTVWLVASPGASPITAEQVRRQLDALATPVSTATVASANIVKFVPGPSSEIRRGTAPYDAAFAGQLALVDAAPRQVVARPGRLEATLRWRGLTNLTGDHLTVIHLRDAADHSWAGRESPVRNEANFPTSAWSTGEWSDATYEVRLPPGMPPDRYTLEVSLYDLASGARLGAVGPEGDFLGTRVPVGTVAVAPPVRPPSAAELGIARSLSITGGALTLIGMSQVPEQVLSGDSLPVDLFWQAEGAPSVDYRVRLRLLGSGNEVALESSLPLSPYPTSRWQAGDRFQSHYALYVSPAVAPGRHRLALNLLDESGNPLWRQDPSLATVAVVPRERSFTMPDVSHPLTVTFGERIHLRGYDLPQMEVVPGEAMPLTLYLEADGPTDRSYTLFVHLLSPEGEPRGQADLIPGNGTAPTTSWAKGQVIVQAIALPVAPDAGPGTYRIAAGFYDAAYGGRLPVTGAAEHILPHNRAVLSEKVTVGP
jgi:4-amino-4-deoxy-L-arabinose transferase-like glycosyltransferase